LPFPLLRCSLLAHVYVSYSLVLSFRFFFSPSLLFLLTSLSFLSLLSSFTFPFSVSLSFFFSLSSFSFVSFLPFFSLLFSSCIALLSPRSEKKGGEDKGRG
jgi:hypothetical protein